jgi:SOS response regulatory protein OraA/RecX
VEDSLPLEQGPPPARGERERALDLAYKALGRRERTVSELRSMLERKRVEPATIDATVSELSDAGYLDDARFARRLAEDKRALERWGSERIDRELHRRGIEPELAARVVAEQDHGRQLDAALDLLEQAEALAATEAETPAVDEPMLSAEQRQRLQAYTPGGNKLLRERIAATREVLERAPDERYALELFVTDNAEPARMERFLLRASDMVPLAEIYLLPVSARRMRVLYGSYASEREALAARERLPPKYQHAFRVAPRSFGELRREM